jgi:hypothetical protein
MTEIIKRPRKLSEERKPEPALRPSHANVLANLERWANSAGLQPPKLPDPENGVSQARA